jgi:hypothetical protein
MTWWEFWASALEVSLCNFACCLAFRTGPTPTNLPLSWERKEATVINQRTLSDQLCLPCLYPPFVRRWPQLSMIWNLINIIQAELDQLRCTWIWSWSWNISLVQCWNWRFEKLSRLIGSFSLCCGGSLLNWTCWWYFATVVLRDGFPVQYLWENHHQNRPNNFFSPCYFHVFLVPTTVLLGPLWSILSLINAGRYLSGIFWSLPAPGRNCFVRVQPWFQYQFCLLFIILVTQ